MATAKVIINSATDINLVINDNTYQPHKNSQPYGMIVHEYLVSGKTYYAVYDKEAFGQKCRVYTDIDYNVMMRCLMSKDLIGIADKEVSITVN